MAPISLAALAQFSGTLADPTGLLGVRIDVNGISTRFLHRRAGPALR
jgi:hypothetical protein